MKLALTLLMSVAAPLTAQQVLYQHIGAGGTTIGRGLRSAGDVDADGVGDFVAPRPVNNGPSQVEVVSGRTGAVIWLLGGLNQGSSIDPLDAVGIGDVDGDGHQDVAVMTYQDVAVYSGATGLVLHHHAGGGDVFTGVCGIGDWNQDGHPDLAVAAYRSGTSAVLLLSGVNSMQVGIITGIPNNNYVGTLRRLGDLDNDGKEELALGISNVVYILDTSPASILRSIAQGQQGTSIDSVDLDGDGRLELVVARSGETAPSGSRGTVTVYDASTGSQRLLLQRPSTYPGNFGHAVCGIGDLDHDGIGDLAIGSTNGEPYGEVFAFSGASGTVLWHQSGWTQVAGCGSGLCSPGDVDGDSFADLAVGCAGAVPGGGWFGLSGGVRADVTLLGGACGGGPFLPQLGMTRPILGRTATIACLNGTPGATGVLALSVQPDTSTYLGASTCTSWLDLPSLLPLLTTTQATWTAPLAVPNAPRLAGIGVALQCFYFPTMGQLGFDLSNGVWARVGY